MDNKVLFNFIFTNSPEQIYVSRDSVVINLKSQWLNTANVDFSLMLLIECGFSWVAWKLVSDGHSGI